MDISVVVPVYGCPAALPELHKRLTDTLEQITDEFEIILVNDACPKGSWQEITQLCDSDERVIGIELSRNFGQIKAIAAGLEHSCGDWVVVMDCDLQDRPEEILNLYNKAQEGYDVVFARRKQRKDGFLKVLVSNMFYKLYSVATDLDYDPALCNFSISKRQVVDSYCSMTETHRAFVMYIKWLGFKQAVIDVEHNERFEGKSGYDFKKRMKMATDILTSQSDKLLKLMAKIGLVITAVSFIMVIFTIVRHFVLQITPGYSSLVSLISFMGGLIITSIGITGIYIGNIFMQVKERPLYVVRTVLNKEAKSRKDQ
ncbi:MAG: glycosyltransferase family 2 protein [Ruminococcus sp.]|nr:glycosyltransferase family 2 protein [Ruminococcus sp.]